LTVSGPTTAELVSAPLSSNTIYSAIITAIDANGLSASTTVGFDTIVPSYSWEAEDWNYTSGGGSGLYIDNPQVNKYAGLASTFGSDFDNANTSYPTGDGSASYRPQGMETEPCSDTPRLAYVGTTNKDFDVGYGTPGGWVNYTRHYPAGLYNVYARLADGSTAQTDTASMSVQSGSAQFIGASPYTFGVKSMGWQTFRFYPLLDANGALVQFTNNGSASTIQLLSDGGNYNANFFILVPANTSSNAAGATFVNYYPDGATQFQDTNSFNFTVSSAAGVPAANVTVQLTATNLAGQGSIKVYTSANGLTITGPVTNLNVGLPLTSNTIYSAFLQAVDLNGTPTSQTVTFDTIVPLYTFEAEDFDYNGGLFFDNPQIGAYNSLDGVSNIDWYVDDPSSGSHTYRQNQNNPDYGPETEGAADVPREGYTNSGATDYDVGFNDSPNWENYTRHYPAGAYNVYMRCASGGGGGSCGLAMVTAGVGTTNQTISKLGTFTVPNTGNWQAYTFAGLKDGNGNLIKVTFSGSAPETLRVFAPSGCNANFYMLQPADTSLPVISSLYPNGTNLFQQTNTLAFSVSSSDGIATSGIVVTLNGAPVSGLVFSGSSTSWNVSYPSLQLNTAYSANIAVKTLAGNTANLAFSFDTFAANNYQLESGDYDYTSNAVPALFFDNPQIDKYNGLVATPGIDEQEVTAGAPINEDVYRPTPDGTTILVCTQSGGDFPRPQFGSSPTWRINWFGFGDFCNYTRHYPAGSYNIVGRFTEGGGASSATLYKVTAGVGTLTQTTSLLGTFNIPLGGWNAWAYGTLVDGSDAPVVVSFDGSKTTLQLAGPVADDGQTINAGFFMLVPAGTVAQGPSITATISGGKINLSLPTVTGSSYQVQSRSSLSTGSWGNLGSPITGNNAVQSVQFPTSGAAGFYRVQVTQ